MQDEQDHKFWYPFPMDGRPINKRSVWCIGRRIPTAKMVSHLVERKGDRGNTGDGVICGRMNTQLWQWWRRWRWLVTTMAKSRRELAKRESIKEDKTKLTPLLVDAQKMFSTLVMSVSYQFFMRASFLIIQKTTLDKYMRMHLVVYLFVCGY